jgi:flagellar biosynthesis/type III secretory pathway chaperone
MSATSPDAGTVRLRCIIEDSIREADALERALEDERRALENRDAAALGAAAEEKRHRVARLEILEAERTAATPESHGARDSARFPMSPDRGLLEGQWRKFLTIVGRCNTLNTTNGAIIRLRRQQITDALRVVSGTRAETYGPSGSESTSRPRQALAAI